MSCPNCERLRRKLSPFEDPDFTANFKMVEPLEWMRAQQACLKNSSEKIVLLFPADLHEEAFGFAGDNADVMNMARTLRALGWCPTKRYGRDCYFMTLEEFDNEYCA